MHTRPMIWCFYSAYQVWTCRVYKIGAITTKHIWCVPYIAWYQAFITWPRQSAFKGMICYRSSRSLRSQRVCCRLSPCWKSYATILGFSTYLMNWKDLRMYYLLAIINRDATCPSTPSIQGNSCYFKGNVPNLALFVIHLLTEYTIECLPRFGKKPRTRLSLWATIHRHWTLSKTFASKSSTY